MTEHDMLVQAYMGHPQNGVENFDFVSRRSGAYNSRPIGCVYYLGSSHQTELVFSPVYCHTNIDHGQHETVQVSCIDDRMDFHVHNLSAFEEVCARVEPQIPLAWQIIHMTSCVLVIEGV